MSQRLTVKQTEQVRGYLLKVARMLNDPAVVFGRFDRDYRNGAGPQPDGSQWVPAFPERHASQALGAHRAPDGHHNVLSIYAANAIGSDLQLVFRALEVLEGTYQPHIAERGA